jgi:glycolate oxidase
LNMSLQEKIVDRLTEIVGEKDCSTKLAELYVYSFDGGIHRRMPDAVVRPRNVNQVQNIVELANQEEVPLVPRGAGTGLVGSAVPIVGGIVVDMQAMNQLHEIRLDGLYAVVEPGMVCDPFNEALKKHGFFIPGPASSEVATLGGMVGLNASGGKALKYGATRDYVIGLTVVLPTGDVIEVGSKTPKNSGGFQFEKFFVGMEGTLGIITEIVMRIAPRPKARAGCVASFDDLEKTGQCVANIVGHGLLPSQLEIMTEICIKAVNKATGMGLLESAGMLLIEVDGHPNVVGEEIELVQKVCRDSGAIAVDYTEDEKRIDELWKGRKQMIPSLSMLQEEYATVMLADDMAVPIYNVPKALTAFDEISRQYDIHIPAYGHAGDGNLHAKVLMDPTNPEHWKQAEEAVARIYDVVLALGGTTTGEHGIGITKAPFFHKERGGAVKAMKAIKRALDPKNIMNPKKLMDWEEGFVAHLRYPFEEPVAQGDLAPWFHEMIKCTQCGFCKGVCPGIQCAAGWDSVSPRGKNALAYGVISGEIEADQSVADRMFQCVLCGDCLRRCPSGIRSPEMIKSARAQLVDAGFAYDTHRAMVENIMKTGNIYGDDSMEVPATDGEAVVFLGCQYGSRLNKTKKYLKIMDRLGMPARLEGGLCCGYPMAVLGFKKALEEYKHRFLDRFKSSEMVAFCPSCTLFLQEEYHFPVKHVLHAILEHLDGQQIEPAQRKVVTYHDPCDLSRGLKVTEEPRQILEKLGYELVEMEHNRSQSRCCGGGGGILTSDMEMSGDISRARILEALDTGAEVLVTACPTCEQVLKKAATGVKDRKIAVKELSDLVWDALK